jgi:hypothetical protein
MKPGALAGTLFGYAARGLTRSKHSVPQPAGGPHMDSQGHPCTAQTASVDAA